MKVFWFALVLFLLLCGMIIFNYIYVNRTVDRLCSLAEGLPKVGSPDCLDAVAGLTEEWEKVKDFIGVSSGIANVDSITDLFSSLRCYAEYSYEAEYERTRALLVNRFRELGAFESFRLEDIF